MFKNMKIGVRMGLGFSVVIVLMIILIMIGLNGMGKINDELAVIVKVENARNELANNMIDNVREVSINMRNILLEKTSALKEEKIKLIAEARKSYDDDFKNYESLIPKDDTTSLNLIAKIKEIQVVSRQLNNKMTELAMAGKSEDAIDLLNKECRPKVRQWIEFVNDIIKYEEERTAVRFGEAQKQYAAVRTAMFVIGTVSVALSAAIVIFLTMGIVRPLRQMAQIAITVGNGDLSRKTGYNSEDEIGSLSKSFDQMIDNLTSAGDKITQRQQEMEQLLGEISAAVNILASSSSQILALTTQLATSTTETATAITETTTTMEEVKQTSKQMSQRAAVVSETAQNTAETSETGRRSVEDAIAGIDKIKEQMDVVAGNIGKLSEQSQKIGTIISTVSDLAVQSNLLAVNASIEAAKAGEEGKGFAVVAQEVRSLATQSKDATNQVRIILSDIQKAISGAVMATERGGKEVEAGLKQSRTAGDTIGRVVEDIMKAAQAAMQIAVATNEQVAGIDQVSLAMGNIKKATEQIVSSTRQSEESSKNLHELGMKLKELVKRHKG